MELMICIDGVTADHDEMFVLSDESDPANAEVERAALDYAYALKREQPDVVVTIVLVS